jgi:hypothetical protein
VTFKRDHIRRRPVVGIGGAFVGLGGNMLLVLLRLGRLVLLGRRVRVGARRLVGRVGGSRAGRAVVRESGGGERSWVVTAVSARSRAE